MRNIVLVAETNARCKHFNALLCVALIEVLPCCDFIEKLATIDKLRNNIQLLWLIEVLIDLQDVGVVEILQDLDLVDHLFVIVFVHLILLEDFDCSFLFRNEVLAQADFSVRAVAEQLRYLVVVLYSFVSLE